MPRARANVLCFRLDDVELRKFNVLLQVVGAPEFARNANKTRLFTAFLDRVHSLFSDKNLLNMEAWRHYYYPRRQRVAEAQEEEEELEELDESMLLEVPRPWRE